MPHNYILVLVFIASMSAENDYYVGLNVGRREFGDFPGGEPVLWLDGACAALHHSKQ